MGNLFSKFSKAVDAFADVLTEDVTSTKSVALYRQSDLKSFVYNTKQKFPSVRKCRVSVTTQNEFDGVVFPEPKYIIRVLLMEENGQPICMEGEKDAYLGTVVIASSIDVKMNEFMKGKTERTVAVRGGK